MQSAPLLVPFQSVKSPKTRPTTSTVYQQAAAIQAKLKEDVDNSKVTASARAQLARAWLELERLKREIRMKPKPKPVDVGFVARGKKLAKVHPFAEPTTAPAPQAIALAPKDATPPPHTEALPPDHTIDTATLNNLAQPADGEHRDDQ